MASAVKKLRKSQTVSNPDSLELVTFQKFYDTVDETTRADLLDGKITYYEPPLIRHAMAVTQAMAIIGTYSDQFAPGSVLSGNVAVRFDDYNAAEPDVFYISKSRRGIINEKYIDGAPDLCVEVISRSSRKYDRGRKFVLYAENGVKEYWIIDPLRDTVEFFENRSGEFVSIPPDEQGRLHSKVLPGFWLKPEWLATEPLPGVLKVLKEILGPGQRL